MRTLKCLMVLAAFLLAAQASYSQTKQKKQLDVASKKVEYGDSNPNIKGEMPTDDNIDKIKKDGEIGAKAGSGYYNCYVRVVNYTAFTIHVYLDGYFAGTMGPYGELNSVTGTGYTTAYGISAGGTTEWSTSGNCSYDYTFKFTE